MWRTLHASVAGKSHLTAGIPCQDFHVVEEAEYNGEKCLIVALADGAGAALYAEEASKFATENWVKIARDCLLSSPDLVEKNLAQWSDQVGENLRSVAQEKGRPLEHYSCTLLGAIVLEDRTLFLQIGDGAWVVQDNTGLHPVTWPERGEYAGHTTFLISRFLSHDGAGTLHQTATIASPKAIAGLTDGLPHWALVFRNKTVNPAFFVPMFQQLAEATDLASLQKPFEGFLNSDMISARTGDDKTLVLISRESGDAHRPE